MTTKKLEINKSTVIPLGIVFVILSVFVGIISAWVNSRDKVAALENQNTVQQKQIDSLNKDNTTAKVQRAKIITNQQTILQTLRQIQKEVP
jgi:flagellar basal body-associated protein FliL